MLLSARSHMNARQVKFVIRIVRAELARRGGQARSRNLTPAERSASAQKASRARWRKAKKQKLIA